MYLHYDRFFKIAILLPLLAGIAIGSSGEGILTVKTDPDGIEVWLGDNFLGQSPVIDKKIKAGHYVLKLVDPAQHSSVTEDLFIQDGDTAVIERTISSKFGSLRVTSVPEAADVYIAAELGKTPLTNDFMNPGKYRIEIRPADSRYNPAVTEAIIPRGQTVTIHQTLSLDTSKSVAKKKRNFLSKKNIISFLLLGGTVGGFTWGVVEQGNYKMFKERQVGKSPTEKRALQGKVDDAAFNRTMGIIVGSVCAIGLELVVLF